LTRETKQWTVTYRNGATKFIECDEIKVHGDWIGFVWHDGSPALIVAADDVRSVEPYQDPPF